MSKTRRATSPTGAEPSVSLRIVQAIADAEDTPTDELDPLYEFIDLEALEALVARADADLHIQWTIHGHRIEVDGTGEVRVV